MYSSHFAKFRVMPTSFNRFSSFMRTSWCCLRVLVKARMSSIIFTTPSKPSNTMRSTSLKISEALAIPMCSLKYLNSPRWVVIVVKLRDDAANLSWWNAFVTSSFENTVAPFVRQIRSSTDFPGYFVRRIALLIGLQSHGRVQRYRGRDI